MAPEILERKSYNLMVDVYSFGVRTSSTLQHSLTNSLTLTQLVDFNVDDVLPRGTLLWFQEAVG